MPWKYKAGIKKIQLKPKAKNENVFIKLPMPLCTEGTFCGYKKYEVASRFGRNVLCSCV